MELVLIGAAIGAFLLFGARRAAAQGKLCVPPLPGQQPKPPEGWTMYRGDVSQTARTTAKQALSLPLGTWFTFEDSSGEELGILLQYHCHEPEEGVQPVGWHKGATLFRHT